MMTDPIDNNKLYCLNIINNTLITISVIYCMIAVIFWMSMYFVTWYCRFVYLNCADWKQRSDMTFGIKIFACIKDLFFYTILHNPKWQNSLIETHKSSLKLLDSVYISTLDETQIFMSLGKVIGVLLSLLMMPYASLLPISWRKSQTCLLFSEIVLYFWSRITKYKLISYRLTLVSLTLMRQLNISVIQTLFGNHSRSILNNKIKLLNHIPKVKESARSKMLDVNFSLKLWGNQ